MSNTIAQAFISERAGISIVDFLADEIDLSKAKIKDCMHKGGVWLKREDEEPQRVKEVKTKIHLDDEVHIYYDEPLLKLKTPLMSVVEDAQQYSVWQLPEGLMPDTSLYSDHLMLESVLEKSLARDIDCYWLSPELAMNSGLVLLVHTRNASSKFQQLEEQGEIERDYQLQLHGNMLPLKTQLQALLGDHCCLVQETSNSAEYTLSDAQHYEADVLDLLDMQLQSIDTEAYDDRFSLRCSRLSFRCPVNGELKDYGC